MGTLRYPAVLRSQTVSELPGQQTLVLSMWSFWECHVRESPISTHMYLWFWLYLQNVHLFLHQVDDQKENLR